MILEKGKVTFKQAFKDFWKGYFDFKGRTTRAGYWWAMLAAYLIILVLAFIVTMCGMLSTKLSGLAVAAFIVIFIMSLAMTIPILMVSFRRWRDAGLSNKGVATLFIIEVLLNVIGIFYDDFANIALSITGIITFIITLLPTDKLTVKTTNAFLNFLFRSK